MTLALCTVLHAFTHAYGTILVPLYLLIVADLKLGGVKAASLVVTVYGLVYCLVSYAAGVLADRSDRRFLLGVGLLGNAAAMILMGVTRRYDVLLLLGVVAGLFGALFHPSANASGLRPLSEATRAWPSGCWRWDRGSGSSWGRNMLGGAPKKPTGRSAGR